MVRDPAADATALPPSATGVLVERWAAIALVVFSLVYTGAFLIGGRQIYEDAAMLYRYALHLADGQGIVWNTGDPPLDGATDLLFMLLLAACHRAGVPVEVAARGISILAHAATVGLVYVVLRRRGAWVVVACLSAAYVAIGPAKTYIAGGFGTTLFAAIAAAVWAMALQLADAPSPRRSALFGVGVIVMGIARPEGVLFGVLMALGVAIYTGRERTASLLAPFLSTTLILGSAYFALRWWYFGEPLPNPYYKKGAFHVYFGNLLITAKYTSLLLGPMLVVPLLAAVSRRSNRKLTLAAIPIVGFAALWVLLSNEMNFFRRFQYPVVPVAAMVWPECIDAVVLTAIGARLGAASKRVRALSVAIAVASALLVVVYQHSAYWPPNWRDAHHELATALHSIRSPDLTMAVSEAGLMPFYSDWRAIDTWGLNDRWIAHHRGITHEYLEKNRPNLVVYHGFTAPDAAPDQSDWGRMVSTLRTYAESRGYRLAGVFGEPANAMYYYRSPG